MKVKGKDWFLIQILGYVFLGILTIIALYPFACLFTSSFSSEHAMINYGMRLIPKEFSLDAYRTVFKRPEQIGKAYMVTIGVTVIGTGISLFVSSMTAYVLFRKELYYRNQLAFILYFTELFNGGLASYYIIVCKNLHLKNTYLVMILVPLFSVFNILVLRNFIKSSIPYSLIDSSRIDGASSFGIFFRIVLPLSKPALASIGLFIALGYWNDWWTAMMFVEKKNMYPLQYTLYRMLSTAQISSVASENAAVINTPTETLKLAMTVVATGPIIFLYPFVQKYFVAGITIGSVKE